MLKSLNDNNPPAKFAIVIAAGGSHLLHKSNEGRSFLSAPRACNLDGILSFRPVFCVWPLNTVLAQVFPLIRSQPRSHCDHKCGTVLRRPTCDDADSSNKETPEQNHCPDHPVRTCRGVQRAIPTLCSFALLFSWPPLQIRRLAPCRATDGAPIACPLRTAVAACGAASWDWSARSA